MSKRRTKEILFVFRGHPDWEESLRRCKVATVSRLQAENCGPAQFTSVKRQGVSEWPVGLSWRGFQFGAAAGAAKAGGWFGWPELLTCRYRHPQRYGGPFIDTPGNDGAARRSELHQHFTLGIDCNSHHTYLTVFWRVRIHPHHPRFERVSSYASGTSPNMASQADHKDRQFLAVIGDEVSKGIETTPLANPPACLVGYECANDREQDSVTGLLLAGIGVSHSISDRA